MSNKQRKITKPNSVNMSKAEDVSDSIHGVEVAEIEAISELSMAVDTDPMVYNEELLKVNIPGLEYVTIPNGKLLVRFLKRPKRKSNLEVVKTKILTSEATGKEKTIVDKSAEALYINRFVVVKIGGKNINTENIEVGDILDCLPVVNYDQYFCPLHKEAIDQSENFYLIPDSYYSFIWKTKNLPVEQRVKTSLIP